MARSDSSSSTERQRKASRKKKKRRSRSRSRSRSTSLRREKRLAKSRSGRSKRLKRSRSRSVSKSRNRRRSSRSRERSRSRSLSRPRDSRSRSRGPRSRSKGRRSTSPRRRRSRSRSKGSDSRSKHSSHRNTPDSKDKPQGSGDIRDAPQMTPMEQAKLRMKVALSAAIASDERLKEKGGNDGDTSMADQARFHRAMDDINSDSFSPAPFMSSRSNPKPVKNEVNFGTNLELILGPAEQTKVVSTESYAHPNLTKDPEESMTKWINKLTCMRQKLLKDSVT